MKRLFQFLLIINLLAHGPAACTKGSNQGDILRVSDGVRVTLSEIVDDLKGVQLVFVGELHNNAGHHRGQLEVIRALKESGVSVAVGLEMFRNTSQADLDRWVDGTLKEEDFQKIYYENWTTDWSLYRDIFLYVRQARIPMIGLNIPPDISRQVASQGFSSLTPEQVGQLPEVTCRVDETYMKFIRRAFGLHGHGNEKNFVYFCEAQIVWDTAMASSLLAFLEKNPAYTVVVLAGSGHAWKRGIPEQVGRQSDDASYRVILPEIQDRLESEVVTLEDADYLYLNR